MIGLRSGVARPLPGHVRISRTPARDGTTLSAILMLTMRLWGLTELRPVTGSMSDDQPPPIRRVPALACLKVSLPPAVDQVVSYGSDGFGRSDPGPGRRG